MADSVMFPTWALSIYNVISVASICLNHIQYPNCLHVLLRPIFDKVCITLPMYICSNKHYPMNNPVDKTVNWTSSEWTFTNEFFPKAYADKKLLICCHNVTLLTFLCTYMAIMWRHKQESCHHLLQSTLSTIIILKYWKVMLLTISDATR